MLFAACEGQERVVCSPPCVISAIPPGSYSQSVDKAGFHLLPVSVVEGQGRAGYGGREGG